mgnify:CR=1 FL=1
MRACERFVLSLVLSLGAAAGQQKTSGAKPVAAPAPAKAQAPKSTTIPAGAVEVEPGVFQHKDAKGKVWLYRRTPFGIAKYEPEPEAEPAGGEDLLASAQGDSVRFERKTPFGVSTWIRKKSELNADEAAAWKRAQSSPAQGKE